MSDFTVDDLYEAFSDLQGISTLIEAMGSEEALDLDDEGRQKAMYFLADSISAISTKIKNVYDNHYADHKAKDDEFYEADVEVKNDEPDEDENYDENYDETEKDSEKKEQASIAG